MAMSVAKGGGGRRRGRRRGGRGGAISDINVTPMVDVMLVLLIVFMVAAPLLTVGVPIDLPKTEAKELNTQSKPVTVTIKPDGTIYLAGGDGNTVDPNKAIDIDSLVADIQPLITAGGDDRIYVRGDTQANYGAVMKVMGVLSKAGYAKIGLITDQAQGQ